MQHRPLVVFWKKPLANQWLVKKLENSVRFPKIQKWITERQCDGKGERLIAAFRDLSKNFHDQYYLLNLGFNCLPRKVPSISFTDEEVQQAEDFLRKLGLREQKFVCFCVRDETYYRDFKPDLNFGGTGNFEFRNAKFINYLKAAKFLRGEGITPVLMGFSTESAPDTFLRPALSPEFRPWIEAYLFSKCIFTVGMMTGTTLYASLFRRPVLWSDVFWRGVPVGSRQDLVLPKKILHRIHSDSKQDKSFLSELHMKKWVQLGPPPDNDWRHFAKIGYECKACSSNEILAAVKDMQEFLQTKKMFPNQKARSLHKQFSKLHLRACKKLGHHPTRLAPSWAKANRNLIEQRNKTYETYWLGHNDETNLEIKELIRARKTKNILMPKES
jgi:putative glycosyltransferase (TIGR04372 family)